VHRWVATVNALPGGKSVESMKQKAQPDAANFPGLFVCGDYMQDSTVNGTFDSAAFVVDLLLTKLRARKYAGKLTKVAEEIREGRQPANENQVTLSRDYHDEYANGQLYEESFKEYFCEHYTCDLIEAIWGWKPPFRLLDCGSANGLTLECFKAKGVEAWGIENNEHVHARTAPEWKDRNLLGDIRDLPFEDGFFDFVYDTSLCYVPEEFVDKAIQELFRVCKVGVFFGGITSDMTKEVIEYHEIFDGVQTLGTQWEWAERFTRNGFRLAMVDQKVLKKAWKIECDANEGDYPWYPDMETMRYCFFSKPDAATHTAAKRGEVSVLRRTPKAKAPKKVVAAE
jgi:SAM-dependent methyltransferase